MWNNPETRSFEIELDRMQRFADLVEEFLQRELHELDARVSAGAERLDPSERDDYVEWHAEDFFEHADELPRVLRNSVVISTFSRLEHYLNETCRIFERVSGSSTSVDDIAGRSIDRAKRYLVKVAKADFPKDAVEWRELQNYRDLRNALVHNDGYVKAGSNLQKWVASSKSLRIANLRVEVRREFVAESLTVYRTFATQLDAAFDGFGLWADVFPVEDADPAA